MEQITLEYQDIIFFGTGEEGSKLQEEFMREIVEVFPNVTFIDKFNKVKGYRQEVHNEPNLDIEYCAWLFAYGYHQISFMFNFMMVSEDVEIKSKLYEVFDLAKKLYPEFVKGATDKGA